MSKHWRTLAALALLSLALWLPRASALEHVVTADERKWLARSANFNYALAQRDLAATFQREHPGVTVMWAGALGLEQRFPNYAEETPGYFGWAQESFEQWLRTTTLHEPLDLLNAGRRWIILFVLAAGVLAYFGLARLLGRGLALLAMLAVAVDPFFVAHSFELHPDGLLSILFLAAAVNYLAWLYGCGQWRYLLLSGLAMGLAGLTKTPAIFLAPAGILLALSALVDARPRQYLTARAILLGLLVWGGLAVATVIIVWPALWVNPVGTLNAMARELLLYAAGHINPNYFRGEVTQSPGALFYPVAYLLRATPLTLFGLGAALVVGLMRRWPLVDVQIRRTVTGLLLFALIFLLGVNLGDKKFDRYLLPAALCLNVIAVLGVTGAVRVAVNLAVTKLSARPPAPLTIGRATFTGALLLVLVGPGLATFTHRPYFLTYYNPLLGGAPGAEAMIMIGWGEGLDEAAVWFNRQPDAAENDIVAWYGDGPLSYFLDDARPVLDFWQPDFWLDADYAAIYVNQRQRAIPSAEALRTLEQGELLHVVSKHGVDWVRIYRMPATLPDFVELQTESATVLGDEIEFAAYTLGEPAVLAGDNFLIRLHLRKLRDTAPTYRQIVRLLAPDDQEVARAETVLNASPLAWPAYTYLHSMAELALPAGSPSGSYRLTVALCDAEDSRRCLTPAAGETAAGETAAGSGSGHLITRVDVQQAVAVAAQYDWDELSLSDLRYDSVLQPGTPLLVNLAADLRTTAPRKLSLRLVDAAEQTVAQADVPLAANMEITLEPPDALAPGEYTLVAIIYDPETLASFPDAAGNFATPLTTLQADGGTEE